MIQLKQSEIELGIALSALIQTANNQLTALIMTEQMYIEQLRQSRGLNDEWMLKNWEKGFEVIEDGQQNNQ